MQKTTSWIFVLTVAVFGFGVHHAVPAEELTFATYPFGDSSRIYRAFRPLTEYIAAETGEGVRLVVTRDYQELSDRLVDGSVDLAWIGSANYVKTRERLPEVRYLATYVERSISAGRVQPFYQSVIVTTAAAPYRSLNDLAGARFGFTSPDSTSGYAYPRMMLDAEGIVPDEFFASVFFLGRHDDVINALLAGSLDAGAVSDGTYYNARDRHGDRVRVLAWSEPIPLDALVAAPHVQPDVAERVRRAVLALDESHRATRAIRDELGWPAVGFESRSDQFYDSVERALDYTATP